MVGTKFVESIFSKVSDTAEEAAKRSKDALTRKVIIRLRDVGYAAYIDCNSVEDYEKKVNEWVTIKTQSKKKGILDMTTLEVEYNNIKFIGEELWNTQYVTTEAKSLFS